MTILGVKIVSSLFPSPKSNKFFFFFYATPKYVQNKPCLITFTWFKPPSFFICFIANSPQNGPLSSLPLPWYIFNTATRVIFNLIQIICFSPQEPRDYFTRSPYKRLQMIVLSALFWYRDHLTHNLSPPLFFPCSLFSSILASLLFTEQARSFVVAISFSLEFSSLSILSWPTSFRSLLKYHFSVRLFLITLWNFPIFLLHPLTSLPICPVHFPYVRVYSLVIFYYLFSFSPPFLMSTKMKVPWRWEFFLCLERCLQHNLCPKGIVFMNDLSFHFKYNA